MCRGTYDDQLQPNTLQYTHVEVTQVSVLTISTRIIMATVLSDGMQAMARPATLLSQTRALYGDCQAAKNIKTTNECLSSLAVGKECIQTSEALVLVYAPYRVVVARSRSSRLYPARAQLIVRLCRQGRPVAFPFLVYCRQAGTGPLCQ